MSFGDTRAGVTSIDGGTGWLTQLRESIAASFPGSTFRGMPDLTHPMLFEADVVILSSAYSGDVSIAQLSPAEQAALREFVLQGGSALLFVDGDGLPGWEVTNESLLDAFGLDVTGDLGGAPIQFAPADSPIAAGPFGTVSGFTFLACGWFDSLGPDALSVAHYTGSGQPAVAWVPPDKLGSGSGIVVAFGDTSMIFDAFFCPECRTVVLNSLAIVGDLLDAACPADFDGSGDLAVADIFAFLAAWFTGDVVLANHNGDCCVSVADIFAFLADWFAGC
jgi:hypothetical protein